MKYGIAPCAAAHLGANGGPGRVAAPGSLVRVQAMEPIAQPVMFPVVIDYDVGEPGAGEHGLGVLGNRGGIEFQSHLRAAVRANEAWIERLGGRLAGAY